MSGRAVGHYVVRWDGLTWDGYTDPGTGETGPVSIGQVVREMRGVAGVTVERADGTVVLRNAGTVGPRMVSDRPTVSAYRARQRAAQPRYVVTLAADSEPVGHLSKLRRMSLAEARETARLAASIGRRPRIFDYYAGAVVS